MPPQFIAGTKCLPQWLAVFYGRVTLVSCTTRNRTPGRLNALRIMRSQVAICYQCEYFANFSITIFMYVR